MGSNPCRALTFAALVIGLTVGPAAADTKLTVGKSAPNADPITPESTVGDVPAEVRRIVESCATAAGFCHSPIGEVGHRPRNGSVVLFRESFWGATRFVAGHEFMT